MIVTHRFKSVKVEREVVLGAQPPRSDFVVIEENGGFVASSISNLQFYRNPIRLSKGDLDRDGVAKSESNSVTNQRMLIEKFIEEHDDLELCGTYIDM